MPVGEMFLCDNKGNRVPAFRNCVDPVPASGITISTGVEGSDVEQTLVAGQLYAIILQESDGYAILASATGVTSTAANIEWVFPSNQWCVFRMPFGKTTLYFEGTGGNMTGYIVKVAD